MTFVVALIYAGTVLLCLGTTAWIVRAWTQRRNWHKTPSDLHYIAVGAALLVSAGIGIVEIISGRGPICPFWTDAQIRFFISETLVSLRL